ncbi:MULTISPECIES: response regulator [Rhizobium]|uniref:response regulator n=1 Tax=Rhizobium TaxID=379 RepID=UPI0007EA2AF3|nr:MULTISPECIES: response regulator [Rhizobium]ANK85064.1 response regulator CheY-like domain-containing protein [Rhizobium sp. N731]ANK90945.1 response regulator CheY-like domain-containing protein [Rhizobium sp. N6212]ANK96974.1 response regulator CheY-like domain-containing protein [Rhizobium sp. N621]ANL03094.1 response regulator CheY-like domain-containing protein [Rhizobium esperanzae]ANL09143.1 response regulator CheY-like domain-containing protein [Rhizobium sp. N1341]
MVYSELVAEFTDSVPCGAPEGNDVGETTGALRKAHHEGHGIMNALRVLVLEDSLIIAMEAEDILRLAGVESIDIVGSLEQARAAIAAEKYDFALLDVNLGEGTSFGFARHLLDVGIPFGFVSGYSDIRDFPCDLQHIPLLVKPFDEKAMSDFLQRLLQAAG